jgi:hypothetical protein
MSAPCSPTGMELGFIAGYIQFFTVLKAHKASFTSLYEHYI